MKGASMAPKRVLLGNLVDFGRGEGDAGHQAALLSNFVAAGHHVHMMTPVRVGAAAALAPYAAQVVFTPSTIRLGLPGSLDALWQLPVIIYARLVWRVQTLYVRVHLWCVVQVWLARLLGMRVVVEHNGWTASERRVRGGGPLLIALERWTQIGAARCAHRSRCVTTGLARLLIEGGCQRERVFVLGNGVDLEKFQPGRDPPAAHGRLRLGFIGLLNPWQGVATALTALQRVQAAHDVEFTIAGDGPLADQLREHSRALGLEKRVHFLGRVAARDAAAVINKFDIALAPYTLGRNDEIGSSSIKIRDYAGCGKPIIAARLPGIAELEAQGWLFTHTPDDAADLARVIATVVALGRVELARLGQCARAYAQTHFDWREIAARVVAEC